MNTEYRLYIEYMERTEWGTRIDEFSVPSFLSKSVNFIKDMASKLSLKLTDVMKLFANKSVFQFFQKIKWSLDYLFKLVKDGHRAYTQIISAISEYVSKTKVGKWTEDKLKGLDEWLQNHPKLKRVGGVVVAGLLIYIWFNMTFIGDVKYDFNLTDVYAALAGKFTLSNLFAGKDGTQLLLLFVTGVIGLSFPWPGPASAKFLYAMVKSFADWAKLKLQKENTYIDMKLTHLLNEITENNISVTYVFKGVSTADIDEIDASFSRFGIKSEPDFNKRKIKVSGNKDKINKVINQYRSNPRIASITAEGLLKEWRAEEVLKQLGGRKFLAMTGAKNFVKDDKERQIMFKLPKAKSGINFVRITLTSMDVYNVEFISLRGTNIKTVATEKGVYNDQLQSVFTKHTGLYTSL
jgi:hypothetical protein